MPKPGLLLARFSRALESILSSKAESSLGVWASMKAKASGRLDPYTQGKQKRTAGTPERLRGDVSFNRNFVTSVITTERRQPRRDTNPRRN